MTDTINKAITRYFTKEGKEITEEEYAGLQGIEDGASKNKAKTKKEVGNVKTNSADSL